MKSNLIKFIGTSVVAFSIASVYAQTQPVISIPVVNSPCMSGPTMVNGKPDTVESAPDAEGFVSIFNGTDLKGWWEDCQTHTTDTKLGGVWIVDPNQHLLFSREEGQNGDILVTNKKYDNYEIILDVWPIFGNDGGVFNRVTASGSCWQSTIDYISGSSVGGSFNEKSWMPGVNLNDDPYLFGGGPTNPSISTWTTFTAGMDPTSFGCSAGGCTSADFEKVWDLNGWNQFRVKFYNGLTAGTKVTMENFFRKVGAKNWVPTYKKQEAQVTPAGPVALQIHGAGRWKAGTYNVYRNIKIRALDTAGNPLVTVGIKKTENNSSAPNLKMVNGKITGEVDVASDVTLSDLRGHVLERFHSEAGSFEHNVLSSYKGVIVAELKNNRGAVHATLSRI